MTNSATPDIREHKSGAGIFLLSPFLLVKWMHLCMRKALTSLHAQSKDSSVVALGNKAACPLRWYPLKRLRVTGLHQPRFLPEYEPPVHERSTDVHVCHRSPVLVPRTGWRLGPFSVTSLCTCVGISMGVSGMAGIQGSSSSCVRPV